MAAVSPEAANVGTRDGSHQDPTKDRGHRELIGLFHSCPASWIPFDHQISFSLGFLRKIRGEGEQWKEGAGIEKPQSPWSRLEDFYLGLEMSILQMDSRPWTKANKEKTNMSLKVTCWHVSMSQPKFITQPRRRTWDAWPCNPVDGVFLGNSAGRYPSEVKAKQGRGNSSSRSYDWGC